MLNQVGGISGRIVNVMYLGAVARYYIKLDHQGEDVIADEHAPRGAAMYQVGDEVTIGIREGRGFVQ